MYAKTKLNPPHRAVGIVRQWNSLTKKLHALVKEHNLAITISTGMKTINFLDVVFDLETGSYKPYSKPNNKIMYVHKMSNHPKNITKSLPTMIQNRLYNISSLSLIHI